MPDKQVKFGIALSYLLIFLNTLFSFIVTPYIISCLGEAEYGVYKTISSLTASLVVLDLGLGSTVTRYVATYKAKKKDSSIPNFIAMSLLQALVVCILLGIVSVIINSTIDTTYAKTFSTDQLITAHKLIKLMTINLMIHIVENVINGVITGNNNFLLGNGIKVLRLVIRAALLILLLTFYGNSCTIAMVDIGVTVFIVCIELFYVVKRMKTRIRFTHWDKSLFLESGKYTLLMFLQSIAIQFNGNVDSVLIGALISTSSVTIYSMSLIIFGLYENLSSAISSVMLPTVVRLVENQARPEDLQRCVEKTGRMQFTVLGAALGAYIALGKNFYSLWLGEKYKDCYWLTLILIIPVTFPMLENVALSILRAQNKMGYRTITLMCSTLCNVVLSVVGIRYIGYWGAAAGTAAYSITNFILMNIYYHKQLRFKVIQLFARIFSRIILCVAIAMVVTAFFKKHLQCSWISFSVCSLVYLAIYSSMMAFWGLNDEEKALIHIRKGRKKI